MDSLEKTQEEKSLEWAVAMKENQSFPFSLPVKTLAKAYVIFVKEEGREPNPVPNSIQRIDAAQQIFEISRWVISSLTRCLDSNKQTKKTATRTNDCVILWYITKDKVRNPRDVGWFFFKSFKQTGFDMTGNADEHDLQRFIAGCRITESFFNSSLPTREEMRPEREMSGLCYSMLCPLRIEDSRNLIRYHENIQDGSGIRASSMWANSGLPRKPFSPYIKKRQFTEDIALDWSWNGYDPEHALWWTKNGFDVVGANDMFKKGVKHPEEARSLLESSPKGWIQAW